MWKCIFQIQMMLEVPKNRIFGDGKILISLDIACLTLVNEQF